MGGNFSCAIDDLKDVYCWGRNTNGQMGDGTLIDKFTATKVVGISNVEDISAGEAHVCAIDSSNDAYCWGDGQYGEIGNGADADVTAPTLVNGGHKYSQIVSGQNHNCALEKNTDLVYCWGLNLVGQLGQGNWNNYYTAPVAVSGLANIVSIDAGTDFNCAKDSSDNLKCWGDNFNHQIINDSPLFYATPQTILSSLASETELVSIGYTNCYKNNSGMKCRGRDVEGTLGNDAALTTSATWVDVLTVDGDSILGESGASFTHCALTNKGADLMCWGLNDYGTVIPDGTGDDVGVPTLLNIP